MKDPDRSGQGPVWPVWPVDVVSLTLRVSDAKEQKSKIDGNLAASPKN